MLKWNAQQVNKWTNIQTYIHTYIPGVRSRHLSRRRTCTWVGCDRTRCIESPAACRRLDAVERTVLRLLHPHLRASSSISAHVAWGIRTSLVPPAGPTVQLRNRRQMSIPIVHHKMPIPICHLHLAIAFPKIVNFKIPNGQMRKWMRKLANAQCQRHTNARCQVLDALMHKCWTSNALMHK